jgi:hypothetical protein
MQQQFIYCYSVVYSRLLPEKLKSYFQMMVIYFKNNIWNMQRRSAIDSI